MGSMADRREFTRRRKGMRVRYSLLGSEEYHDARLVDLGEGGLCMESCAPLRTGLAIYVEVAGQDDVGADGRRSFRGRVRWTRDLGDREQTRYGIGVQYTRPVSHCSQDRKYS
jgi:hypothetical protein